MSPDLSRWLLGSCIGLLAATGLACLLMYQLLLAVRTTRAITPSRTLSFSTQALTIRPHHAAPSLPKPVSPPLASPPAAPLLPQPPVSASCQMRQGLQGEAPISSENTRYACASGGKLVKRHGGGYIPEKIP